MKSAVKIPIPLLLNKAIPTSAKLVWMVIRHLSPPGATEVAQLRRLTGLSDPTVRKALATLFDQGLITTSTRGNTRVTDLAPNSPSVDLPRDLLVDGRVAAVARLLYGFLSLTPSFSKQAGQFTYVQLGDLSGIHPKTIKKAVCDLARFGWLQADQADRHKPVHFTLCHPVLERVQAELAAVQRRVERAPYLGEAIMKELLSLLVASDQFENNARPGFLVNPRTRELMEFDRFYPPSVAFEFQGPQHYQSSERFSEDEVNEQKARDLMKMGICCLRSIRLAMIYPEDLSVDGMTKKVGDLLPLRDLIDLKPIVDYLEEVAYRYRMAVKRSGWRAPAEPW